jgi:hypothetical protein
MRECRAPRPGRGRRGRARRQGVFGASRERTAGHARPKVGHFGFVQVKTGDADVPLHTLDDTVADKWFVYTDHDQELPAFVERISQDDLVAYMESGAKSLPPVTERWMRRKVGQ